jgi:hypothetical protein
MMIILFYLSFLLHCTDGLICHRTDGIPSDVLMKETAPGGRGKHLSVIGDTLRHASTAAMRQMFTGFAFRILLQ